jgi:hypothetical protein
LEEIASDFLDTAPAFAAANRSLERSPAAIFRVVLTACGIA